MNDLTSAMIFDLHKSTVKYKSTVRCVISPVVIALLLTKSVMSRGDTDGASSLLVTVLRGETSHDLHMNQVTTDVLRRLFHVCIYIDYVTTYVACT